VNEDVPWRIPYFKTLQDEGYANLFDSCNQFSYEIYRGKLAKTLVALNLTGHFIHNSRIYHAMGLGACLLTHDFQKDILLRMPFEEGRHMVVYRGLDSLLQQAERITRDGDLAYEIGERSRVRILEHHLVQHEAQYVANIVDLLL